MKATRVVLAGFYPPPYAGEPIHVKQLAEFLRARGLDVEILNLNRHAPPSPEYLSAAGRWAIVRALFGRPAQDSVLHLHTNGHNWKSWMVILVAALAARLKGTRSILTVHSGIFPGYVAGFGWMRRHLAGVVLRSFARILCVNQSIAVAMKRLGISTPQAVVIPAFLGVGEPQGLAASDRALIESFHPLLVAVGGGDRDPELGLPIVVQACRQLLPDMPRLGAVFIGWQVGQKTQPLIEELGLSTHAVCLGEVSHERCLGLLQAADVIVRSTFVDGDAITVREALGLGVPVVASDTDFRPDGVVLFRKGDARDLLEKLKGVLSRPAPTRDQHAPDAKAAEMLWQLYAEFTDQGATAQLVTRTPRRLPSMSFAELICRSRQELSKRLDRLSPRGARSMHDPAAARLVDRVHDLAPDRLFSGAADPATAALLAARVPGSHERIVAAADATLQKRFDLLGYRDLSFGDPIDWHLDPTTGRRAPRRHWSRLDPLDAARVGDSKVIWELNRHQWLVRLGQAYRLTRDERYPAMASGAIRSWIEANPRGIGLNWASSLEVAFRLIAWCWTLMLFRDSHGLSKGIRARMLEGIAAHAAHVEKYLSYYFSPNTHLTGEALGLVYAGTLLSTLSPAARWRELGRTILVRESTRQILPDGTYFEQSTCYHRYTAEIYLHFLILAKRNHAAIPTEVTERVQRLLDALLALQQPDGSLPQIGDADGGWLLPLDVTAPDDPRPVFSTAAALFHRSDYAWAAGGLVADTIWLLGPEGANAFDHLPPAPPARPPSRLLPEGGYAVMRSDWSHRANHVILDGGPLGCPVSGGHGHADLLSLQCSFRGEPFLVDPGTFRYTADEGWRSYYRTTAAHSTVDIDGAGQAQPRSPFAWHARPRARITRWISTDTLDFAEAEHAAYHCLPDPVTHRRQVLLLKAGYCVVVDDLHGAAEHRVDLRFQFAPMPVTLEPTLWARAQPRATAALLVRAFATTSLKVTVLEGETEPRQGWISCDYGCHEPAPLLVYSTTARLPLRIITLLWPTADPFSPPPAVTLLGEESDTPPGLLFRDRGDVLYVDRPELIAEAQ